MEEWAGGSRVQQPDPVGSLSPHVLGSEPCSSFLVVHQPQLFLPFVLSLLPLPPRNSCPATWLKWGTTAGINDPSVSGDLIP